MNNKEYRPEEIPDFIQSCHSEFDGIHLVDEIIKDGCLMCPECEETLEYKSGRNGYSDYVGCPKKSCNYYISYKKLLGLAKKHCPTCKCEEVPIIRKEQEQEKIEPGNSSIDYDLAF